MRIFQLIGGILNLVYFLAMLFGFLMLLFLFILVFPPIIGIVVALLVAAGIVLGVRDHLMQERVEDTEVNG